RDAYAPPWGCWRESSRRGPLLAGSAPLARRCRTMLPDRRRKDPEIVAANDLGGVRGGEATAQHRVHQACEGVILLDEARIGLLIRADAHVIHSDDVRHFLETIHVPFEARKKMPDAN